MRTGYFLNSTCDRVGKTLQCYATLPFLKIDMRHQNPQLRAPYIQILEILKIYLSLKDYKNHVSPAAIFFFFFDSMFISVEDHTGRIRFSYNYSMSFTCSQ